MYKLTLTDEGKALLARYHDGKRTISLSHVSVSGEGCEAACPITGKSADGKLLIVSATAKSTGLGKGFMADTVGLWAKSGTAKVLFAQGTANVGYVPGTPTALDTTKIVVAVAIDDVEAVHVNEIPTPGMVAQGDFKATVAKLREDIKVSQANATNAFSMTPNKRLAVSGSGETNRNPTAKMYATKGTVLTEKRGLAAGTYTLRELLNNLVKLSHTHGKTNVVNVGAGVKNCNGVTDNQCGNCHNCADSNCTQCTQCAQCGQCGECSQCKTHCLDKWQKDIGLKEECVEKCGVRMRGPTAMGCAPLLSKDGGRGNGGGNGGGNIGDMITECASMPGKYPVQCTQCDYTECTYGEIECEYVECRECLPQKGGYGSYYYICKV